MEFRCKVKRKGRDQVLDLRGRRPGSFDEFLRYEVNLLSRISSQAEFFLHFLYCDSRFRRILDGCVHEELCEISYRHREMTVLHPGNWDNVAEILRTLRAANRNGADGFATATAGYIPKLTFFSRKPWFRRHLVHLKWYCLFYLEYPRLELWSRRGVDKTCDDLFDRVKAGGLPWDNNRSSWAPSPTTGSGTI